MLGAEDKFLEVIGRLVHAEIHSPPGAVDLAAIVAMTVIVLFRSKDELLIYLVNAFSRAWVNLLNYLGQVKAMKLNRKWDALPHEERPPPAAHDDRRITMVGAIVVLLGSPIVVVLATGVPWT
jgi:hypothetical protein